MLENKRRLEKVRAFMTAEQTPQYLRRTSLAMQLTSHVHGICAQSLGRGNLPVLVTLAQGRVREAVQLDLGRILANLWFDPVLDTLATVGLLVATAAELVVRFQQYEAYPYLLSRLCSAYNPLFRMDCMNFLQTAEESLDCGFGLPLLGLARSCGSEAEALGYLLSDSVQAALRTAFVASSSSSLPAERRFAEIKRSEAPRLCHVSVAGRNMMQRQFLRWRSERLEQISRAQKLLRRQMRTNLQSLAWQLRPDLVGQPHLFVTAASGARPLAVAHSTVALREYVAAHRDSLQAELARRRSEARVVLLAAKQSAVPLTEAEWATWFADADNGFGDLMRVATAARKARSRRLVADPTLPPAAARVQPVVALVDSGVPPSRLAGLLQGREGWHGLRHGRDAKVFFLYHHRGCTYAVDISGLRRQGKYRLTANLRFADLLIPLGRLVDSVAAESEVYELIVDAIAQPDVVLLDVRGSSLVTEPLRRRRQPRAPAEERPDEGVCSESSASSVGMQNPVHRDGKVSSSDEASVDTDVDTEVETGPKLLGGKHGDEAACVSDVASDGSDRAPEFDADDGGAVELRRHPAGTFKLWESLWFYITQTPGWLDVKIHIKSPLRQVSTGMGTTSMSKTLTAYHFGEIQDNPVRTMLLLRGWGIWRARLHGWAAQREGRIRDVAQQLGALEADVRRADGRDEPKKPLCEHERFHRALENWVPDLVLRVCQ